MTEFFHQIIQPGMLPFTVSLGFVLLYWIVCCAGLVDLDMFDGAVDGVLEGSLDGAVDGAIDGALDGAADAAADGALDGAADAVSSGGVFQSLAAFANFGKVPATIVLSILIFVMWVLAYLYHTLLLPKIGGFGFPILVVSLVMFVPIFLIGIGVTGLITRPLRPVFEDVRRLGHHQLVGQICVIKTTRVTDSFGQAELTHDGATLLLSVFCTSDNKLSRGNDAVIVGYVGSVDKYEVRAMD